MRLNGAIVGNSLAELGLSLLVLLVGIAALECVVYIVAKKILKKRAIVAMLLAPAFVGLLALIVYPIIYEFRLAFSDMSLSTFRNPSFGISHAIDNLTRLFTRPVLQQTLFYPILLRTILWTSIQVVFHVTLGMGLALLLNTNIRFKTLYKGLLIIPWAIPDIISVLAWRGEYHFEYGFVNIMLTRLGFEAINWKADPLWNFTAMNITNIWLGIPFMMVICLGGLQSISREYYEAAEIDGARGRQKFFSITLPLMKPIITPAVILGIIWTFNNFNVPYFINQFELESSDILVTALFRAAFEYNQYGFAAMFALVIFLILFGISLIYFRVTGALRDIR